jgi:hypothetical protein
VTPSDLMVSVECPTFRTLLVAQHDANTPAQDRSQLGVGELLNDAVVVDRRVDDLDARDKTPVREPSVAILDEAAM